MIKVKDGYAKLIGTTYEGSADRVLLSNGDHIVKTTASTANTLVLRNSSGLIESTLATGTAPFKITSTSLNTNLNADMLDGWHLEDIVKSGYVFSNTENLTSYWGKLWEHTLTGTENTDLTLYLHSAFAGIRGIIHISLRRNNSTVDGVTTYSMVVWVTQIAGNIPTDRVRLYYNNSGLCLLWVNVNSRYGVFNCRVISCTSRTSSEYKLIGTLFKTNFTTEQTLPTDDYKTLTNSITTTVEQHNTNNTEYPLIWSNQTNTNTVTADLLHKSYPNLTYNPHVNRITASSFKAIDSVYANGQIELQGPAPYIDFHYSNSTKDFTNRIIEGLAGLLTVTGKFRIGLSHSTSTDYNFYVNGTSYFNDSITTKSIYPSVDCYHDIGSTSAEFRHTRTRGIATRHLDASAVYSGDTNLYIGYGWIAPTARTYIYTSSRAEDGTISRTPWFDVNNNGALALTRFGVNGLSTNHTFFVNGTSYLGGKTRIAGNLEIGNNPTRNYIAFHSTTGDGDGGFNHTYIGENIYYDAESSELVLFKGNDLASNAANPNGTGPDRIRYIAAGHLFQIYKSPVSGTFESVCTSTKPVNTLAINADDVTSYLSVLPSTNNTLNLGSSSLKWANIYSTKFIGDLLGSANASSKLHMTTITTYSGLTPIGVYGYTNTNNDAASNDFPYANTSSAIAWGKDSCKVIIAARAGLTTADVYIRLYYTDWGSWYKLWNEGNDGSGSGLDADLLDGIHANGLLTDLSSGTTNKVSITVGGTTKSITTLYASYLCSIGVVAPLTGRTLAYGDVYSYRTKSEESAVGAPTRYTAVIGFGRGNGGTVEICGEWTSDRGLWARALRDTTDDWYAWDRILTEATYTTVLDSRYYTETEVNDKLSKYLPLSGGTLSGLAQIQRAGSMVPWYLGRTSAMIRINSYSGYNAIASMKTTDGDWSMGVYHNNILYFTYVTDTNFNANTNTTTALVSINASGSVYATHFYESSDINLKTNIEAITASDNIPLLKVFDWKDSGKHSYGLIAQELEEQGYSELVSTKDDGYKTVNYSAALSLIVGKLQVKIKELEKEIENLKNKN